MRPASGVWKPAIDMSVVDFPQPLGPSSVKSSPSATSNETSSSARLSVNCLTRDSTWISGIVTSRHADLEDDRAEEAHEHRDADLHHRERRDRADDPLQERVEHRRSDHFRPGTDEKERRVVVVEDLDEQQAERGEERGLEQWHDDAPARAPPAGADRAAGAVELLTDARHRRVHDD